MILDSSSMYFVGSDMDVIRGIRKKMPDIYEEYLSPPYTDQFSVQGRTIVWLCEQKFPEIKLQYEGRETTEGYARAIISAMVNAGVPERALRIYRQTLTFEEL